MCFISRQFISHVLAAKLLLLKLVDTDQLCAASRVSVAFRLKQSKDGDDKTIDVKLEASQGGENKIDFDILFKV